LQPLSLATAHRIVLKPYLSDPLTARRSKSRFCDGRTYAVFYAAGDFATAFAEVVVRDRLVQRDRRFVPFGDITARGWVEFSSNDVPLQMVDLSAHEWKAKLSERNPFVLDVLSKKKIFLVGDENGLAELGRHQS
jgi:hypothetical protein